MVKYLYLSSNILVNLKVCLKSFIIEVPVTFISFQTPFL